MPADHSPPTLPTARPLGAPTSPALSPQEAAARAKVSRRTIMRAVEAGGLAARRDNRNRWNIAPEDLDRWADAQWAPTGQRPPNAHPLAHSAAQEETALELAAARATIAQLEARLTDRAALVRAAEDRTRAAEADRDRWRELVDKLTARLAERPAEPPRPSTSARRRWPWARR